MRKIFCRLACAFLALFVFSVSSSWASVTGAFEMSLEELMNIEVTSVAKKPQQLRDIPAAVHIISAEDIERSGATCIPEALRLAPGVHVMQLSNNRWAVAIRGAAREYSNKLLVLVDGRSVYMPTFSGVMWETLGVPLSNIQRIEIIRGPGAAIWGSNAVNGVINIITLPASEASGGLLELAAGDELKNSAFLRYGYSQNKNTFVRLHASGFEYGQSSHSAGQRSEDAWQDRNAGFRLDREVENKRFSIQGNLFRSRADDLLTMFSRPPSVENILYSQKKQGFNLVARWENELADGRKQTVQTSFESFQLHHIYIDENRQTFDFELTERLEFRKKHDVVWGFSSRLTWDTVDHSRFFEIVDRKRQMSLHRLFLNDDIELRPEKLRLLLAGSLEHNDVTGIEFQPSIRLMATPDKINSLWLAWSKAVRTPSRVEDGAGYYAFADLTPPVPLTAYVLLDNVDSEKLESYDAGWRRKINNKMNLNLSGFYFRYTDGFGSEQTGMTFDPAGYLVIDRILNNNTRADSRGYELTLEYRPSRRWQLQGNYSYINTNLSLPANSTVADVAENVPERVWSMFSRLQLSDALDFDVFYRHSSQNKCGQYGPIPGFDIVDTKLTWKIKNGPAVSTTIQNLFDREHSEFLPEVLFTQRREFGRRFYIKSEWSF